RKGHRPPSPCAAEEPPDHHFWMNATTSFDGCSADGRWRYIMCPRSRHGGGAEEQISGRLLGRKHDDRFAGRQRSDQSVEGSLQPKLESVLTPDQKTKYEAFQAAQPRTLERRKIGRE